MSNIEQHNQQGELEASLKTDNTIAPHVDVLEYDDSLHLIFQLPGVKRNQLDIHAEGDMLSVSTTGISSAEREYRHQEFLLQNYARQFRVSRKYDLSRIHAVYEDGELRLRVPKSEKEKARKVTIQ